MKIGSHDTQEKVVIVAEIGNNHEGDMNRARQLIHAAADAGVDIVKFQTIVPERLVCTDQRERLAQLRRFQLSRENHAALASEAAKCGVVFLSTPFAIDTIEWLDELVPAYKVASGDNDFWPLLNCLARTGKPIIVSLGLGGGQQASRLVAYFEDMWTKHGVKGGALALLHCVSTYPTPEESAGLAVLYELRNLGVTIGYSDHTLGIKVAELAVAAGARIIEKHFTLDKSQSEFRDHQLSADPAEMRDLVAAVRRVERIFEVFNDPAIDEANKVAARRSIAAARDLAESTVIQWKDLTWLRPGNGLRPGEEQRVIGRKVRQHIRAGQLILPDQLY